MPEAGPYDARAEAKRLLRGVRAGALATLTPEGPFASLVSVATLPDGSPLFVLSRLAAHTRHIEADPRCSLLLAERGKGDPLAHPRLTLVGRAIRAETGQRAGWRARFLARHPKAELYADFADFSFWRLDISGAHLNGGFARAARFEAAAILTDNEGAEALIENEAKTISNLDPEQGAALRLYAAARGGGRQGKWRISGLDPDGIDLVLGDRTARLPFPERLTRPDDLHRFLAQLAQASPERQSG